MKKMKKIIIVLIAVFQLSNVYSQSMGKGKNVLYIGAGAGTGYFGSKSYKGIGYSYRSTPTFHLGFEHGVSEAIPQSIIGLGGALSSWFGSQNYSDKNGYTWERKWTDLTVVFKGYYHHKFLVGEKWDVYGAALIGIKHRTYSYTSNNPNNLNTYADETGVYPAGGVALGGRFYVSKVFGFYAEAGAGVNTDYIQGGFAFKF